MQTSAIKPEQNANSFTTQSGRTYIIHPSVTAKRLGVLEKLQAEFQHGVSLSGFLDETKSAYDLLNKSKVADAGVKLYNVIHGASRIANGQPHPIFFICALFMCEPDEDQGKWVEADMVEKISDWDGVDADFFLGAAKLFLRRYTSGLTTGFQNFSEQINPGTSDQ